MWEWIGRLLKWVSYPFKWAMERFIESTVSKYPVEIDPIEVQIGLSGITRKKKNTIDVLIYADVHNKEDREISWREKEILFVEDETDSGEDLTRPVRHYEGKIKLDDIFEKGEEGGINIPPRNHKFCFGGKFVLQEGEAEKFINAESLYLRWKKLESGKLSNFFALFSNGEKWNSQPVAVRGKNPEQEETKIPGDWEAVSNQ